ncbi:MAG: M23 family metallopeptidase [Treponema sp.]|nr:M23 family metallopeptidase [Treponema sp.]
MTLWGIREARAGPSLPFINRLESRDIMFRQYISDVELARRRLFSLNRIEGRVRAEERSEELAAFLTIYAYIPQEGDSLLAIAARCNIPYGTIASLNGISNMEDPLGSFILLPSMPGIFIHELPDTDLQMLLFSARSETGVQVTIPGAGRSERFYFFPGDDFSATERIFFLNRGFQFPLREFRLTSSFGPRINPVTGGHSNHRGLDLAAPEGTEVFAARAGIVTEIGYDSILGRYIIVSHDNNWVSLYGHLSAVNVRERAEVRAGSMIGRVGSTGQSTGPHLHFELHHAGQSRDPERYLRLFQ